MDGVVWDFSNQCGWVVADGAAVVRGLVFDATCDASGALLLSLVLPAATKKDGELAWCPAAKEENMMPARVRLTKSMALVEPEIVVVGGGNACSFNPRTQLAHTSSAGARREFYQDSRRGR
jgi:hypothetical protein